MTEFRITRRNHIRTKDKNIFPKVHTRKSNYFRGHDLSDDGATKGNESRFVRCQWCKAINDIELRDRGDGRGGNTILNDDVSGSNLKRPSVGGAGCWFCGSSEGW